MQHISAGHVRNFQGTLFISSILIEFKAALPLPHVLHTQVAPRLCTLARDQTIDVQVDDAVSGTVPLAYVVAFASGGAKDVTQRCGLVTT